MPASTLETAESAGLEAAPAAASRSATTGLADLRSGLTPGSIVQLQRRIGNRAVQRLLAGRQLSRRGSELGSKIEEVGELFSGVALEEEMEATNAVAVGRRVLARREFHTPPDEIRRSLSSPGRAEAGLDSRALSLYNFGHDHAELKQFHRDLLIELASFIRTEITVPVRVRIDGNTSSPGTDPYNLGLGMRRAKAVAALLRANGVTDVEIVSHGELTPAASNETEDGRSRNRRVDLQLMPAPGPGPQPPQPQPDPDPDPDPVPPPRPDPVPPPPPPPPKPRKSICERFPILCGLLPIIPIPFLPVPWGLICVIAPELCAALPCIIDPALCLPKPKPKPPKPPDKPDPPKRKPRAVFGPVRAPNTPSAMGDRIPDHGSTPVAVVLADYDPTVGPILIRPVGAQPVNGEFLIEGGATASILGSTLIDVAGTTQTSDRAGGFKLRLEAVLGTEAIGLSAPFAVSDIMENMRTRHDSDIVDDTGGAMVVKMSWDSDGASGLRSLDLMEYNENLEVVREEGGFVGFGVGDQGPTGLPVLAEMEQFDTHGTPRSRWSSPGRQELMQVHTLLDHRTGSTGQDIPVTNSGFLITRVVEPDPARPGCPRFVITKAGRAGNAGGFRSGAGGGRAQLIVPLACPPGPGPGPGPGPRPHGGGGSTPATPSLPMPHIGPLPPDHIPFGYVSGVPHDPFVGQPVVMTIVFGAQSTDPRHPGRQLFTAPIPCVVTGVTPTHVNLRTANLMPLSLAPPGFSLTVLPALNDIAVPRRLL